MRNVCTVEKDGRIVAHPEYRPDLTHSAATLDEAVGGLIARYPAVFGTLVYDTSGTLYEPPQQPPPAKPAKTTKPAD